MKQNSILYQKRKVKGLTQQELAAMLGVKANTICNYEKGKRKPRGEVALKLSKILEISLEDLII